MKLSHILTALLIAFLCAENIEALRFYHSDYNAFMDKVKERIPKGSTVLAGAVYWFALHKDYKLVVSEVVMHKQILEDNHIFDPYFEGTADDFFLRQGVEYVVHDQESIEGRIFQQETIRPFVLNPFLCSIESVFFDNFYNYSVYANRRSPNRLLTMIYKVRKT